MSQTVHRTSDVVSTEWYIRKSLLELVRGSLEETKWHWSHLFFFFFSIRNYHDLTFQEWSIFIFTSEITSCFAFLNTSHCLHMFCMCVGCSSTQSEWCTEFFCFVVTHLCTTTQPVINKAYNYIIIYCYHLSTLFQCRLCRNPASYSPPHCPPLCPTSLSKMLNKISCSLHQCVALLEAAPNNTTICHFPRAMVLQLILGSHDSSTIHTSANSYFKSDLRKPWNYMLREAPDALPSLYFFCQLL